MSEEQNKVIGSTDTVGSPNNLAGPADTAGESAQNSTEKVDEGSKEETVSKSQYDSLESKLGEQGNELGQYREFYEQISPILDKLDSQPELVKAIMDDKIDGSLAQSVLDGKVSVKEAEVVTEAHKEVIKEVGQKEYKNLSPAEVEKLIEEKFSKLADPMRKDLNNKLNDAEKIRVYENSINEFINKTEDFPEYAEKISKWFSDNPKQDDIKVAYDAVKGAVLQEKFDSDKSKTDAEKAKELALNAGSGSGSGSGEINAESTVDSLISGISNPNSF